MAKRKTAPLKSIDELLAQIAKAAPGETILVSAGAVYQLHTKS